MTDVTQLTPQIRAPRGNDPHAVERQLYLQDARGHSGELAGNRNMNDMRHRLDDPIRGWRRIARLLDNGKTSRVVLALILGAMGSLPLVILTPPFQVPDEVQHFYRAYQLSEFHLRAEVQNGAAGGTFPSSLPQVVKASVYTSDGIAYPATPEPIAKTLQLRSIPLDPSTRQFVAFPGSAFYSPLPYVPQALGIAAGRAMGAGPLLLLYLGRLCNCLSALALLCLAVYCAPFADEVFIFAGLLPMSLYLYASISPDAAVIGCALAFTALSIAAGAQGSWGTRSLWLAAALAAVFCSVKPPYAPMLLAGIVPGLFRPGSALKAIRSTAILLGVAMGATAGWLLYAKSTMTTPLSGTNPSQQIILVLHHPIFLVRELLHILGIGSLVNLYVQGVGEFGWLTVFLRPAIVYVLPLVSVILLWRLGVRGSQERSPISALWYLALALASAALIVFTLYLWWAHVGQDYAAGVQGRYFIPLLGLAGIGAIELTPRRRTPAPQWQTLLSIAAISLVEIVAMDVTIVRAFHVF